MASINDLPEEIIAQILNYFNIEPLSITHNNQEPSISLLHIANSPLKSCSSLCQTWRRIAMPLLFQCLRVPLRDIMPVWHTNAQFPEPEHETRARLCIQQNSWHHDFALAGNLMLSSNAVDFYKFLQHHELAPQVHSLLLFAEHEVLVGLGVQQLSSQGLVPRTGAGLSSLKSAYVRFHQNLVIESLWRHVLGRLDPLILTICAPPRTLGSLVCGCNVDLTDAWVFGIEYQSLQLRQDSLSATKAHSQHSSQSEEPFTMLDPLHLNPESHVMTVKDVLTLRNWNELTYHGGSCLRALGTYHYFEKMPPCFLAHNPVLANLLGTNLTHFSYKSVFAHVSHFRRVISLLLRLDNLQSLALQLAPAPDSAVLDDQDMIGKGNLRLQDCWMEAERVYSEVIRSVLCKDPIAVLEHLTSFTSYDCRRGALREELEAAFATEAPQWVKSGEFTWTVLEVAIDQAEDN